MRRNPKYLGKWRFRLVALLALPGVAVAQPQSGVVTVPGTSTAYFTLPPAGVGEFTFEVRDLAANLQGGSVGGVLEVPVAAFDQYAFTSLDPAACSVPTVQPYFSSQVVRFAFAAAGSGGFRTCRYRVARAANAGSDLGFNACLLRSQDASPYCSQRVRIGSLPDLELALDTVGAGTEDGTLLRLRLVNRSSQEVASRVATTDCHEFGGGLFGPTAFELDGDFPGGCPTAFGTACASFTGQRFDSRAFQLGPAPPQGSSTCLVRVVPRGNTGLGQVPLFLYRDVVGLPGGAIGFDPLRERETVTVGFGLPGAVPVPVGPAALAAILLSMLLAGAVALHRPRRRAQSA